MKTPKAHNVLFSFVYPLHYKVQGHSSQNSQFSSQTQRRFILYHVALINILFINKFGGLRKKNGYFVVKDFSTCPKNQVLFKGFNDC